jgi:TolA-binding protein
LLPGSNGSSSLSASGSSVKKPRLELTKSSNGSHSGQTISKPDSGLLDPSNSEHVIALAQLKEQISSLQKQVKAKDNELLDRDKKVCKVFHLLWSPFAFRFPFILVTVSNNF